MRTLSASAAVEGGPEDLDNLVADKLEALRQRIGQRLRFRRGGWFLDSSLGTVSVLGHETTVPIAAAVLTDAIRDEGGAEVLDVVDVTATLDRETRTLSYRARVRTIYGDMAVAATA